MMILTLLVTVIVLAVYGRILAWILGWPMDVRSMGRWGLALLTTAVILAGLPELLRALHSPSDVMPWVNLADIIPTLGAFGLVALGYVAWNRGEAARERHARDEEQARHQPRHRAAPPPPNEPPAGPHGFRPLGRGPDGT